MISFALLLLQTGTVPQQPADQANVVVVGKRNVEDEIKDFVEALTPAQGQKRLARFERFVCPAVIGLSKPQAEVAVARMRRVAREIELATPAPPCAPNVILMVTRDKKVLLEQLRRRHPQYFETLSRWQVQRLIREPGPAVAWQTKGPPVSARGVELFYDEGKGYFVNQTSDPATRLYEASREQFDGAVVVVERGALDGLTIMQLADYASMRAYSPADPKRLQQAGGSSILRVIEAPMGSVIPNSMTAWDFGYLKGYYSSNRNAPRGVQRSEIQKDVAREVADK